MNRRAALAVQAVLCLALLGVAIWAVTEREKALAYLGLADTPAKAASERADPGIPVIVAEVTGRPDDVRVQAVGTGAAVRSVTVRSQVPGQAERIMFDAGDRVERGQPLVRLDDRQEQLALDLAEVRLRDAQRNVDRLQKLRNRGSAAGVTLEDAETAAALARIERDQAASALAKRTVRAPFAGVTGIPLIDPGSRIDEQTPVVNLDDRSSIRVRFDVPEEYLARLPVGSLIEARTPAFADRMFEGTVVEIDSRVDALSRTAPVRAEIPNSDDLLRPGMSFGVSARLPGEIRAAVPQLALQWARNGAYVWRVRDGAAEQAEVRLLGREAGLALVEGDIAPGELVVIEGVQRLRPGRPVRVLGEAAGDGGERS